MSQKTAGKTTLIIKRLTGVDLDATRSFLRTQCFVEGKGFSSQYAGQGVVSCTTTAMCVYALSETGPLTQPEKSEFQRILLAFRRNSPSGQAGAFPRTTGQTPSAWTTGQATLALDSLGAPWQVIQPSVEWLLRTQSVNGGWNFPGTDTSHQRLIYSFYPALVVSRFRARLGKRGAKALARLSIFLDSCEERDVRIVVAASETLAVHRRNFWERSAYAGQALVIHPVLGTLRGGVADDPCRRGLAPRPLQYGPDARLELPAPSALSSSG